MYVHVRADGWLTVYVMYSVTSSMCSPRKRINSVKDFDHMSILNIAHQSFNINREELMIGEIIIIDLQM